MSLLLLAVLPLTFGHGQAHRAGVQIAVDALQAESSVVQQVTYKRREVIEFDSPSSTPSEIVALTQSDVQSAGIKPFTAAANLNSNPDKQYFRLFCWSTDVPYT